MPLPTFRRDDYLTAGQLNDLVVALKRSAVAIVEGCGLTLEQSEGGTVIGLAHAARQLARIVSGPDSQGRYAWQGVYRKPDGTHDDLGPSISDNSLADPAYELNSIRAVTPGTRVLLTRSPTTGEWVFTAPPLMLVGKTGGSGVPAMSGAVPGSATVTLYAYDGTTLTATAQTVAAKNEASTAAGANKFVQMKIGPGGHPFLDFEDCP
jgi:hypothetical protein